MVPAIKRSILIFIFAISLVSPVFSDDLTVEAGIDSVKVFQVGAEVTRVGTVTVPAGEHRLIFSDLPPRIDPARLQLILGNTDVSLGTIQIEELHEGELVSEEEQQLQAELDDLLFDRQGIVDEIESANTQLKLLDSLASGGNDGQQTDLNGDQLVALLDTLATASNQARQLIREANRRLAELDREIEQKRFELEQVATRDRTQQVVTAAVEADAPITTEVSLTYPVNEARWTWLYESRLDTEARSLEIGRKVSVVQATGENWDGVSMSITTARPNRNTQTPRLRSLLVDLYQPPQVMLERARAGQSAPLVSADALAFEGPAVVTGANIAATEYLVDFEIPGVVTVAADSQPQILPIDQRRMPVELVTRAVPDMDRNAYLEVRFTLEGTVPLQSGPMQFYRDGAFIGRRGVATLQPQDEVSLPFGQDERVRVEIRQEEQESRDGGTFRRNAVEDHRVRYEVTSFHTQPIELEILSRIPVSQNQAIEVETDDDATPYDEIDVDGNTGVVLWRRQAQPTETVEIRHYYSVIYPEDESLQYR